MSIGRVAARGVAWNMAIGVLSRVLQLVGNLILLRLIAPDAYAEVITASICMVTASTLTSFAFGQYLISKKSPPEVAFQAWAFHIAIGVISVVIVLVLGGVLGDLFEMPSLSSYLIGYAIAQIIDRIRYVPDRLLIRALKFRTCAAINGSGEIVFTVTALALAPRYGGYAIVIGQVVRSVWITSLILWFAPRAEWWSPRRLEGPVIKDLLGYCWPILVGALAERAASMWDNLIVTKLFTPAVMALYNQSYSLSKMPVDHVGDHIAEVLMPSFARMEPEHRRSAVVRAASLMVLVVAPLSVGLSAVSPSLVDALFNEKWAPMAPMLAILAAAFVFPPLPWSAFSFLQAEQRTRLIMILSFFNATIVLGLVALLGWQFGTEGACFGVMIGFACNAIVTILLAGYTSGLPVGPYLIGVTRPLLACVPMYLVVNLVRIGLAGVVPNLVSLGLQIVAGVAVYVAAAFVVARPSVRELIRLARRTKQG